MKIAISAKRSLYKKERLSFYSSVALSSTHISRPLIPAITIKNQKNGCLQFISVKLSANSTSTAAHCA